VCLYALSLFLPFSFHSSLSLVLYLVSECVASLILYLYFLTFFTHVPIPGGHLGLLKYLAAKGHYLSTADVKWFSLEYVRLSPVQ
jgi:hypothetical protein